jgi:hypothetical protein
MAGPQPSKLLMGVRSSSSAPCAASSAVEQPTLNRKGGSSILSRRTLARVTLTRQSWRAQTSPSAGSNPAPRTNGEWCNQATRLPLKQESPGSSPGSPAPPPRTACGPAFVQRAARFDPGWRLSIRSYSSGRETTLRAWTARVRVPPSVRRPSDRCPSAPCKGSGPVRPWGGAPVGGSSIGRAAVFGTAGSRFESWAPSPTPA